MVCVVTGWRGERGQEHSSGVREKVVYSMLYQNSDGDGNKADQHSSN